MVVSLSVLITVGRSSIRIRTVSLDVCQRNILGTSVCSNSRRVRAIGPIPARSSLIQNVRAFRFLSPSSACSANAFCAFSDPVLAERVITPLGENCQPRAISAFFWSFEIVPETQSWRVSVPSWRVGWTHTPNFLFSLTPM